MTQRLNAGISRRQGGSHVLGHELSAVGVSSRVWDTVLAAAVMTDTEGTVK